MDASMTAPQWRSTYGFLAAALGSAVGLGNIWRFAYVAGENGGGAFVLVYVLAVLVIGVPLLVGELALGRATRADPVAAFRAIAPSAPWRWVGWLGVAASLGILAYYPIVTGWVLSFLILHLTAAGSGVGDAAATIRFDALLRSPGHQLAATIAVVTLCAAVVMAGVERGIERSCRLAVPVFVLLLVALAVHGLSLAGAARALEFLLAPDWAALLRPRTYLAAIGQAFFSIGLAMAVLVAYGAYLPRTSALPAAALGLAAGDTLIALVAGLMIFPAVFTFGFAPTHGAGLAFVVMPQIFATMAGGWWVGLAFYLLLLLAALTSLVALIEVPVALLISRRGWTRRRAATAAGAGAVCLATPVVLGDELLRAVMPGSVSALESLDQAVSNLVLPLSGIGIALVIGWMWPDGDARAASGLGRRGIAAAWLWLLRVPLPALIALVMLAALGVV